MCCCNNDTISLVFILCMINSVTVMQCVFSPHQKRTFIPHIKQQKEMKIVDNYIQQRHKRIVIVSLLVCILIAIHIILGS